ncbi:O-antigen ligase family protein [Pusillimonas sp.]|uniref:O-antigen ligase family protein n=1 Tax=Pusillimonas sp. TaxID=3040095 RepID=UPI0037C8A175
MLEHKENPLLSNLLVALYILLPITLLTSHSLPSGVFYALILTSLILLTQTRFAGAGGQTYRYRWLIACYGVLFLAVAASSVYHGHWAGANSEGALRFFVGLWVLLLALPQLGRQRLQRVCWGIYGGGVVSTIIIVWLAAATSSRPEAPTIIIVSYSSIMMLLCALIVYSLKWQLSRFPAWERVFKIVLACAVFIGFLAAQTRTGLLGLPIFVLLGIVLFAGNAKPGRVVVILMVAAVLAVAAVANTDGLRNRIAEGVQEIQTCQGSNGTQYNSMCIRLQMWRTAIHGGINHPWFGLGNGGMFNQYMQDVGVPNGLVAQEVVDEPFGEPHSDLLLMFFGFGLPGALGLLLVYLAPCFYFVPRLLSKETSGQAKAAAAMGLAVCLGFLCFGITETMFRRMNTIGFYVALVAWLMVLSDPQTPKAKPLRQGTPGQTGLS